jgi:hypothetical protein
MLRVGSCGFGALALAVLASERAAAEGPGQLDPRPGHFPGRARRVIFLFMDGGPSHVDTFDYKPRLARDNGQPFPGSRDRRVFASPWKFPPSPSGIPISELFPHLAGQARHLCVLNAMYTDSPNHPQAIIQLHTGVTQSIRPSLGSWVLYGLGTEKRNLPGFITINPQLRLGGAQSFSSAFLPATFEGTQIQMSAARGASEPIAYIANRQLSPDQQRLQLDLAQTFNRDRLARDEVNTQLEGLIASYETAFRMQAAVPHWMDLSGETRETFALYGLDDRVTADFGAKCLVARRFAEAGVRFIQLTHSGWDHHAGLQTRLVKGTSEIDKPIAGLLADLERRGMLDETLVIWGGEFGRTPFGGLRPDGRDHNPAGFTMWLAGGGVRGGMRFGATDEYGEKAVEGRVHIHDLHATILHLLGLDHTRLTYRYSGRDFRLTDVHGQVIREILT